MWHPDDLASLLPCLFLHVAVAPEGLQPSAVLGVLRPPRALRHPGELPAPELLDDLGRRPRLRPDRPGARRAAQGAIAGPVTPVVVERDGGNPLPVDVL